MRNYKTSIIRKVEVTKNYNRIVNPLIYELEDLVNDCVLSDDEADQIFMMIIDGIVDYEIDLIIRGFVILNDLKVINGIIQGEHYA